MPFLSDSAPNIPIMRVVTSRYGSETILPSTVSMVPLSSIGAVSSREEMNCELTSPLIDTSPPLFGPWTVTGGRPSLDEHLTPQDVSASRSGPIGLFFSESSPVIVTGLSNMEQIPENSLMVVPEFLASTGTVGADRSPPSMVAVSPSMDTDAPMALQASMVARVSADSRQLSTTDRPSAMEARKRALCVWLLEGGGETSPSMSPPRNVMVVIRIASWKSKSFLPGPDPDPSRTKVRRPRAPLWPRPVRSRTSRHRALPCPRPVPRRSCPRLGRRI